MTIRIYSNLPVLLTLLTASISTTQASAQALATAPAQPITAAVMAEEAAPTGYRSALESYQRYSDERIVNWKQANDTTGQIGGWRAYAKEASQVASPDVGAKPANSTVPAKP